MQPVQGDRAHAESGSPATVELLYETDCPNVSDTRRELLRAFAEIGAPPRWHEWNVADHEAPERARGYGSPTVLVNGRDVAGQEPADARCGCRLYPWPDRQLGRHPLARDIARALRSVASAGADVG